MADWPFHGLTESPDLNVDGVSRLVLPADHTAPRQARRQLTQRCAGLPPDLVQTAELITSELVSNAVLHPVPRDDGQEVVGLAIRLSSEALRVEVSDHDQRLPTLRTPVEVMEGGWGLHLVVRLAHGCGVFALPDGLGKTVWFELRLQ